MRLAILPKERQLSRGQRLLAQDPAAAVETLRAVVGAAPGDAQAKLFLAIALADAGRSADAIPELEAAMKLESASAVFPMELGLLHLDEGRVEEAKTWFAKAAALAPDNALAEVLPLLARWDAGEGTAAADLSRRTRDRASRFQARVLVRVERCFLLGTRPDCTRDAAPMPVRRMPDLFDRVWEAPRVRRKARALIAAGQFDAAASVLLQAREDFEGDELLDGLLPKALEGAFRELTDEIQDLLRRKAAAPPRPVPSGFFGKLLARLFPGEDLEAQRRDAIFRLADALLQMERWADAAVRLDEFWKSWKAAGEPIREKHYAVAVSIAAAEVAARRREWDSGLVWAARAAALEPDGKDAIRAEALARIGKGEDRAARRLFERFLDGSLYAAEDRLRELITGKKAFIAT